MSFYYMTCRSLTYAQNMSRVLSAQGVTNSIVRTPSGMSPDGCGYSVKVREGLYNNCLWAFRSSGVYPKKMFLVGDDGTFREVFA